MIWRILGGIYLGDIAATQLADDLNQVTHVLLIVNGPVLLATDKSHLHIDIEDEPLANLMKHLPEAMKFIDLALFPDGDKLNPKKHQGAVLVHCAQAVLRSVAVIVAYLMYNYKLSYKNALYAVKRKKEDVEPNEGFAVQVEQFGAWDFKVDEDSKEYLEFLIQLSLARDPTGEELRLMKVYKPREARYTELFDLRCKRCRHTLATNDDVEPHEQPGPDLKQAKFIKTAGWKRWVVSTEEALSDCSHWFMPEPAAWMAPELESQELEGKFLCPKCEAKVGGYSWQGLRCLCGRWMVPAIHLSTAKVDKMVKLDLGAIKVEHDTVKEAKQV